MGQEDYLPARPEVLDELLVRPDADELEKCRNLGESLARHLTGRIEHRELDLAAIA